MADIAHPAPGADARPHRGSLILVLGILSVALCSVLGPFAWAMGSGDRRAMQVHEMDAEGKSLTEVGMYLGIAGTCIMAFQLCIGMLYAVILVGLVLSARP